MNVCSVYLVADHPLKLFTVDRTSLPLSAYFNRLCTGRRQIAQSYTGDVAMFTRMTSRSAACLLALLLGGLVTASIRLDTASQEIAAVAPENAAAATVVGIDIPALTATAGEAHLPVVAVRDPI
jgi:acyl-CoA synthetase (AMP-forming)/AMP-acid ligase II